MTLLPESFFPFCANAANDELICNKTRSSCYLLDPCKNGGICSDDRSRLHGYVCSCPSGFFDRNCNFQPRSCSLNPCWHDGMTIFRVQLYRIYRRYISVLRYMWWNIWRKIQLFLSIRLGGSCMRDKSRSLSQCPLQEPRPMWNSAGHLQVSLSDWQLLGSRLSNHLWKDGSSTDRLEVTWLCLNHCHVCGCHVRHHHGHPEVLCGYRSSRWRTGTGLAREAKKEAQTSDRTVHLCSCNTISAFNNGIGHIE